MLSFYLKLYPLSLSTATIITILSLMPFPEIELVEDVPLADKWVHFVMYGTLTTIIWFEYNRHHTKHQWGKLLLWAIIAPAAMSGIIEILQSTCTATRNGDWWDFVANSIGVGLGTVVGLCLKRLMRVSP